MGRTCGLVRTERREPGMKTDVGPAQAGAVLPRGGIGPSSPSADLREG